MFFINNKYRFHKINNPHFFIAFLLVPLFFTSPSYAQDDQIEYKIKAGYLYNFTKFIFWPEDESETFNLCILGKDPFGSIINPIEKRKVKNKFIRLYRLQSITEVKHCHIVFFGNPETKEGSSDLPLSRILTVSESTHFTHSGGMIAFILKQGKVKLQINLQTLRKSGLEISAKLLEVAEIYHGGSDD